MLIYINFKAIFLGYIDIQRPKKVNEENFLTKLRSIKHFYIYNEESFTTGNI